ncbi:MAG: RNA methyltransferase, partial [Nanoarchaeota archaeon]
VIMNPPFGSQKKGYDVQFLDRALKLAPIIYSLHNAQTEEYLARYASNNGLRIDRTYRYDMPLKKTMQHHTRRLLRIAVIGLRLTR